MASITIRKLNETVKARLRMRAAEHGNSMEEEARCILRDALNREHPLNLADLAREIFGPEHGVELPPHPPVRPKPPPDFESE